MDDQKKGEDVNKSPRKITKFKLILLKILGFLIT